MVTFHALALGMTLQPLPNKTMYWMSGRVGTTVFPEYGLFMSRNRFTEIKRFFHLRNNEGRDSFSNKSGEFRLWQNAKFIKLLNSNFQQYYFPGRVITVDERTIPLRNRMCPIRVYNAKKPYKFGMELFTLCDAISYYCYNFKVYDKVPQVGLQSKVVLELCRALPVGVKFDIILDRGFTSPKLLQDLKKMGHLATGTVVSNRKFLPKKTSGFQLDEKVPQGEYKAMVCTTNEMIALIWKDRRLVHFLSTSKGTSFIFICCYLFLFFLNYIMLIRVIFYKNQKKAIL